MKACDHNIPETLKGPGACQIVSQVKKRNGKPHWWCLTHGSESSAPDGAPLERCPDAWLIAVPDERTFDLHVGDGEFSVWGAIKPAIEIGTVPHEKGNVHVHHRPKAGAKKDVDTSFSIVRVHHGDVTVEIENMAAVALAVAELSGQQVTVLQCNKARCGAFHIDEQKFAATPHVKHQCNQCGRAFRAHHRSVGNPLADAYERLDLPRPPQIHVDRPLHLNRADYSGIALWATNSAIVSTSSRPEEIGIHVHTWDHHGHQVIDETYSPVYLDGELLDERLLRVLNVQRALVHETPILNVACKDCGTAMLSPTNGWMDPNTKHTCQNCGATNKTKRRAFLNPLAEK